MCSYRITLQVKNNNKYRRWNHKWEKYKYGGGVSEVKHLWGYTFHSCKHIQRGNTNDEEKRLAKAIALICMSY